MAKRQKTGQRPVTVRDVDSAAFVNAYAAHLKQQGKLDLPDWVEYIKTSRARELPPQDKDWYYIRCAAIARRIYLRPGTGTGGLTKVFSSGNYRKGVKPNHHTLASAGNIRHALQQLGKLGIIEAHGDKGRRVSKQGQRDLDRIAQSVLTASAKASE